MHDMAGEMMITVRGSHPPLALEFHPQGRAFYVRLSNEVATRTDELDDAVLADYDEHGRLVGFEILDMRGPALPDVLARLRERFAAEAPQLASVRVVLA